MSSDIPLVLTVVLWVTDEGLRCLNSSRALSACMSFQLTHSLSESGYPFHLTRYWTLCPLPCCLEVQDCFYFIFFCSSELGQEVASCSWNRGTPFRYKELEGLHGIHRVFSMFLEVSADK
jgi:hypothetical protein